MFTIAATQSTVLCWSSEYQITTSLAWFTPSLCFCPLGLDGPDCENPTKLFPLALLTLKNFKSTQHCTVCNWPFYSNKLITSFSNPYQPRELLFHSVRLSFFHTNRIRTNQPSPLYQKWPATMKVNWLAKSMPLYFRHGCYIACTQYLTL